MLKSDAKVICSYVDTNIINGALRAAYWHKVLWFKFISLAHESYELITQTLEIAPRGILENAIDDMTTLVQVMAWCRQASSHYLSQRWPRSLLAYGITEPHWIQLVASSMRCESSFVTTLKWHVCCVLFHTCLYFLHCNLLEIKLPTHLPTWHKYRLKHSPSLFHGLFYCPTVQGDCERV